MGVFVSAEQSQAKSSLLEALRAEHTAMLAEWEDLIMQLEEQAAIS